MTSNKQQPKEREPILITEAKSDKTYAYITLRVPMELFFSVSKKEDKITALKNFLKLEKKKK